PNTYMKNYFLSYTCTNELIESLKCSTIFSSGRWMEMRGCLSSNYKLILNEGAGSRIPSRSALA
ncbi:MAG: hypothetical protein ACK518_00950, partial [bacterium]